MNSNIHGVQPKPSLKGGWVVAFLMLVVFSQFLLAQSTGPFSPSNTVNDASNGGATVWNTPSNANTSNNAFTVNNLVTSTPTYRLKSTSFGFSIPGTDVIDGVEVKVELYASGSGDYDSEAKLIIAGTPSGLNRAVGTAIPLTESVITYGGQFDLWGLTLTPTDINSSSFGFGFAGAGIMGTALYVDNQNIKIYHHSPPSVNLTSMNVYCFGGNDGLVNSSVSGGVAPYTYLWSNSSTSQNINGLSAGTYTVTVSDAHSHTTTSSIVVNQPTPLSGVNSVTNVLCFGGSNGSIDLTPSGGTPPYSYLWSNSATTQDITSLVAGTYTVSITDANGCFVSFGDAITQPASLSANAGNDVNVCLGSPVVIGGSPTAMGGTPNYTYNWSPSGTLSSSNVANPTSTAASSTNYFVTITDANGCVSIDNMWVFVNPNPVASAGADKFVCYWETTQIGGAPTASGGTPTYTYSWSSSGTLDDYASANPNVTSLGVGSNMFTVTVTDINGCKSTDVMYVERNSQVNLVVSSTDITCFGASNGTTTSSTTGFTTPFSYLWSNGSTTQNLSGLSAGAYTLTVTDVNNCTNIKSTSVNEPTTTTVTTTTPITVTDPYSAVGGGEVTCEGATAVTQRGVCWSTSSNPTTANNLTYDGAGLGSFSSNLTGLTPATPYFVRAYAINSNGTSYGSETSFYTLSTEPYGHAGSFVASNPTSNTIDLNWTQPGNTSGYIILYKSGSLPSATPVDGVFYTQGNSLGDATVGAVITSGSTINTTITGLSVGTYYFTIFAFNKGGNNTTVNYITSPTIPSASETINCMAVTSSVTDALCYGSSTGSINITSNGTPRYTYKQVGNGTTFNSTTTYPAVYANYYMGNKIQMLIRASDITEINTAIGSIAFNVTSVVGTALQNFTIRMKHTGNTTISTMDMGTFTTVYSVASYAETTGWNTHVFDTPFNWDGSSNILVEVCFNNTGYTTNASTQLTNLGYNSCVYYRADNGTVCSSSSITAASTSRPNMRLGYGYNYSWSNGQTTQNVSGLAAGTYSVSINDGGCTQTKSFAVDGPDQMIASASMVSEPNCYGGIDGIASVSVSGGVTSYNYLWSHDAQTSQTATGLAAGTYTVTVADQNSCSTTSSVVVSQPAPINSYTSGTSISCYSLCDASAIVTSSGGTSPYTYLWSPSAGSQNTESVTNLCGGNHDVTITDANSCKDYDSYFVNNPLGLSGYYTVGGTSPNYNTIGEAIADLECKGVSGTVTIAIRPGTYNEQVEVGSITGASVSNTIYFMSSTNIADDVIISYDATSSIDNFVVKLNGAKYITFDDLTIQSLDNTYSKVVEFSGSAQYITFQDSKLIGVAASDASYEKAVIYSGGDQNDNVTISSCEIMNGSFGVKMQGVNSGARESGFNINTSTISGQFITAIDLQFMYEPVVYSNEISSGSGYSNYTGVHCYDCADEMTIFANSIIGNGVNGYGIYLNNSNGSGSFYGGTINNIIKLGLDNATKGIYTNNCSMQTIYHNTVLIESSDVNNGYVFFADGGSNIVVRNNIFMNSGGGFSVYAGTPSPISSMDYNNLFIVGGNFGIFEGNFYNNIVDWQIGSSWDLNSYFEDPGFVSPTNLRLSCSSSANMISGGYDLSCCVTTDIDGESRAVSYSIGADEFDPSAPMAGTYHIGTGQQYETFIQAVADLVCRGTSNPVTFLVHDGTYNEQVEIPYIGTNQISFNSFSNDSSLVTLTYAANNVANYTLLLNGADYISFNRITIEGTDPSYSRCVEYKNNADYNNFYNCRFIAPIQATTGLENAIVYSGNTNDIGNGFYNCRFVGGSKGIYMAGSGIGTEEGGTSVYDCYFIQQQVSGVHLEYQSGAIINNNMFTTSAADAFGAAIYLYYCVESMQIQKNVVRYPNQPLGIYLDNCTTTGASSIDIYNNQVYFNDYGGIYLTECQYAKIFHNSVKSASTDPNASGIAIILSSVSMSIVNNIVSMPGGRCISYDDQTGVADMDFNDLYTTGTDIGWWGPYGLVPDLSTWQSVTGWDGSSIAVDPVFENDSILNLTCASPSVLNNGTDITSFVPDDIYSQTRSVPPYMGAHEFIPDAPLSGTYTIGGTSPDFATINEAVEQLVCRGVSGATYFDIRPGTYTEQVTIPIISGATAGNEIYFRSETGDSTDVTIQYTANISSNYTVRITGSYIYLQQLTIQALDNTYGHAVVLENYCTYNHINQCVLVGISTTSDANDLAVVYTPSTDENYNHVDGCRIVDGSIGVLFLANSNPDIEFSNYIVNNEFTNQYYSAIFASFQQNLIVSHNKISTNSTYSGYVGINLYKEGSYSFVTSNIIAANNVQGIGIYLLTIDASATPGSSELLIYNNFVSLGAPAGGRGIAVENSLYVNMYYNSVSLQANNYSTSSAFYELTSSNISLANNIFASSGDAFAIDVESSTHFTSLDYNDYYSTGADLANHGGGAITTLGDWQSTTGQDYNSYNLDPVFADVSSGNLHLTPNTPFLLKNAADLSPNITVDIDGNTRSSFPWMGADEVIVFYWVGDGGNWSDFSNHWANSSGGAGFYTATPSAMDFVVFDANSFSGAGQIVNMDVNGTCKSISFLEQSETPVIVGSGSLIVGP